MHSNEDCDDGYCGAGCDWSCHDDEDEEEDDDLW
jgi:hypothetical protein